MFDGIYSLENRGPVGQNIWNEYSESPIVFREEGCPPLLQYKWEFERLLEIFRVYSPFGIIEIGSWKGGSLYQWMKNTIPIAHLYSISSDADEHWLQQEAAKWANNFGHRVAVDNRNSHDSYVLENCKAFFGGQRIDFLFIDGDHSYAGARQDFMDYGDLVEEGGLIVLQDILYAERHPECEVYKLWTDIKQAGYKTQEFYTHPSQSGLGIGIVYK